MYYIYIPCRHDILNVFCIFSAHQIPFRLGVVFDGSEVGTAVNMADTNEKFASPGGIIGFQLNFWQRAC
jgi:hypothetical protein